MERRGRELLTPGPPAEASSSPVTARMVSRICSASRRRGVPRPERRMAGSVGGGGARGNDRGGRRGPEVGDRQRQRQRGRLLAQSRQLPPERQDLLLVLPLEPAVEAVVLVVDLPVSQLRQLVLQWRTLGHG